MTMVTQEASNKIMMLLSAIASSIVSKRLKDGVGNRKKTTFE